MGNLLNFNEVSLSKSEMGAITGGKKLLSKTLCTDELGTYYLLRYDDDSEEIVPVDWFA